MSKKDKYVRGYKGPGMCKHCTEQVYNRVIRKNWCCWWCLPIRKAVHNCKGIQNAKG